MHCLHPTATAIDMIAILGVETISQSGFADAYSIVLANFGLLLKMALIINNLLPGRGDPWRLQHHPHYWQLIRPMIRSMSFE
ncbi:MAG: hypothetical protein R3341_04825 [Methylophaga sp.]|nr:hypothetical protein [Methylophaga sp.]